MEHRGRPSRSGDSQYVVSFALDCEANRRSRIRSRPSGRAGGLRRRREGRSRRRRIRYTDKRETKTNRHTAASVDDELPRQVSADPARCVVHRHRRPVQVASAREPEQAVSQILSLEQDHDQKHNNQAGHCQRFEQWPDNALATCKGSNSGRWISTGTGYACSTGAVPIAERSAGEIEVWASDFFSSLPSS